MIDDKKNNEPNDDTDDVCIEHCISICQDCMIRLVVDEYKKRHPQAHVSFLKEEEQEEEPIPDHIF